MNNTVQEMFRSFDKLSLDKDNFEISDQQHEHLLNIVEGVKRYQQYYRMTDGALEAGRITPPEGYAPDSEPMRCRGSSDFNDITVPYGMSCTEADDFEKYGITQPFEVLSRNEAEHLYHLSYQLFDNGFFERNHACGQDFVKQLKQCDNWGMLYASFWQATNVPEYVDALSRPQIVNKLLRLLGGDLMCWRTQLFEIAPQQPGTFWHQASSFKETSLAPKLKFGEGVDPRIGQLSSWIALCDTDMTNGCMQYVMGSHLHSAFEKFWYEYKDNTVAFLVNKSEEELYKTLKTLLYSPTIFHKVYDVLRECANHISWIFDGMEVKPYIMRAGEGVLFTSMVCHASYSNTTDKPRLAIGGRYTTTDTEVYPGFTTDFAPTKDGLIEFPVEGIKSFMLSGKQKCPTNRMWAPFEGYPPTGL